MLIGNVELRATIETWNVFSGLKCLERCEEKDCTADFHLIPSSSIQCLS